MKTNAISNLRSTALPIVAAVGLGSLAGCSSPDQSQATYNSYPESMSYSGASFQQEEPLSGQASSQQGQASVVVEPGESTNTVIPLFKESINVGKREVNAGTVRVRKTVETETINHPVELRREQVVIEREQGGDQSNQNQALAQAFEEGEIVIQLKREEPVVEKETTPAGQIVIQSRATTEQTNLQAQVRREDVDVTREGTAQNVIIGQNVQASTSGNEAIGAAESPGGQSAGTGAGSTKTITDPSQISSGQASMLAGSPVQLSQLKVQQVLGGRLVVLESDTGQNLYAVSTQPSISIRPGDTVNLTGTLKRATDSSALQLNSEAAQLLSSQRFYIDAQNIEPANQ